MTKPRVTPEEAYAMWLTLKNADPKGKEPSMRGVAKALNATGCYEPVYHMQIARWRDRGWAQFRGVIAEVAALGQDEIPADTGKIIAECKDKSDQEIVKQLARDGAVASIIVLRQMMAADPARIMQRATTIASVISMLTSQLSMLSMVLGAGEGARVINLTGTAIQQDDTLASAWDEFEQRSAKAN